MARVTYEAQVAPLVRVLPHVADKNVFALNGGAAGTGQNAHPAEATGRGAVAAGQTESVAPRHRLTRIWQLLPFPQRLMRGACGIFVPTASIAGQAQGNKARSRRSRLGRAFCVLVT